MGQGHIVTKLDLFDQANKLVKEWNCDPSGERALERLEILLENYLKDQSHDTEVWYMLALAVNTVPLADHPKAIACLERILEYDPDNIRALLLIVSIRSYFCGIDQALLKKLESVTSDQRNLLSLIEYAKAMCYGAIDDNYMYEKSLIKSIEYCDKYVWNYVRLGDQYVNQGKKVEGIKLIAQGLKNVKKIFRRGDFLDIINLERYIDEYLRGIDISSANFEYIINMLVKAAIKVGSVKNFV